MPFQPFATRSAEQRAVLIPSELGAEERERFIKRIKSAVQKQAESAQKCDAILRVQTEVQVEQDRILITHEPAAVADPEIIESSDDRPGIDTLWWLTASLVRALCGFAADKAPHGGIQPGALYLDQTGRVKLGDFGIAPAYESVCGLDNRRYLACDTAANESGGVGLSGCWGLLNEDESRDYGWIAPYFAHELLDGRVRLNFKSDQFALGVLLFLLASGTHPYGAALSDPTLLFYFHLEPYALDDERSDWEKIFERESKGVAGSADKPVLAWAELVRRMCAGPEASDRCSSPAEAEEQVKPHLQPAWEEASAAIAGAVECLENGQADAALEGVSAWVDNEALSDIWRERLSAWAKRLEAEKEVIVHRNALKRRLEDGQAALDDQDLERARAIAKEVAADEQADDTLMREVDRLLRECDEHEEFVQKGAGELANQYLESGREALAKGEFKEARENFEAVLKDPAMPSALVEQANKRLLEIEATEKRGKEQLAALNEAIVEYREGRYAEARKRLEALLADEALPESVAAQARLLLKDVIETGDRVAEFTHALDDTQAAWERADLAAMEDCLGSVPQDFADPNITTRRGELVELYDKLRTAVEHKRNGERLLEADDAAAALQESRQAAAIEPLPLVLLEELAALTGRCEQKVREQQAAILENAGAMLDKAELSYEAGSAAECRELVDAVLQTEGLSSEIITRASNLHESYETLQQALAALDTAQRHLGEDRFGEADAALDGASTEGLPKVVAERSAALRAEIKTARDDVVERERLRLERQIDEVIAAEAEGKLEHADTVLGTLERSQHLPDAMRSRVAELRSTIAAQLPILETVKAAEAALNGDGADSARVLSLLDELPGDLPAWADSRVAAIRARAEEIEEQRRRAAAERIENALQTTEQKLDELDWKAARTALERIAKDVSADAAFAKRHKDLAARAEALAKHMPTVEQLEQSFVAGKVPEVSHKLIALLKDKSIPEPAVKRLKTLRAKCKAKITEAREKVTAELKTLEAALAACQFRDAALGKRIAAIAADPLITKEQRAAADALQQKHDELPEKKRPWWWIPAAIVLTTAIVVAAWILWPRLITAEQMDAAIARITLDLNQMAENSSQELRDFKFGYTLEDSGGATLTLTVQGETPPDRYVKNHGELDAITGDDYFNHVIRTVPITPTQMQTEIARIKRDLNSMAKNLSRELRDFKFEYTLEDNGGAILTLTVKDETPAARPVKNLDELKGINADDYFTSIDGGPLSPTLEQRVKATLQRLQKSATSFGLGERDRDPTFPADITLAFKAVDGGLLPAHLRATAIGKSPPTVTLTDSPVTEDQLESLSFIESWENTLRTAWPPPPQITHLGANTRIVNAGIGAAYDDELVIAVEKDVTSRNAAGKLVEVRADVRLEQDSGRDESFELRGTVDDGVLTVKEPPETEFKKYLAGLQESKAPSADSLWNNLAVANPGGLIATVAPTFAGGDTATMVLSDANDRSKVLASLLYDWEPHSLSYVLRKDDAIQSIRVGVRARVNDEAWTRLLTAVAPGAGRPGSAYFARCKVLNATPVNRPEVGVFHTVFNVEIGPDTSLGRRFAIKLEAHLAFRDGQIEWARDAKAAIAAEIEELSANAAKATLVETLKMLAATKSVAPVDFVSALRGITEDKASTMGVPSYVVGAALANVKLSPDEGLGADPANVKLSPCEALLEISKALQNLVAPNLFKPNGDRDRFPVVFVEYFVGDEQVYGLRWRADTDAKDLIDGVSGLRVWSVMTTAELSTVNSVKTALALPGEKLLGLALDETALDKTLQASNGAKGGSFGLMVAPHKQLWWTRWERVQFDPRPVDERLYNGDVTPITNDVSSLRKVLWENLRGRRGIGYRRVGIWCVPALGGEFDPALPRGFDIWPGALRAVRHPAAGDALEIAIVRDSGNDSNSGSWSKNKDRMNLRTIGYSFWGTVRETEPNPVSFFVPQLRQP